MLYREDQLGNSSERVFDGCTYTSPWDFVLSFWRSYHRCHAGLAQGLQQPTATRRCVSTLYRAVRETWVRRRFVATWQLPRTASQEEEPAAAERFLCDMLPTMGPPQIPLTPNPSYRRSLVPLVVGWLMLSWWRSCCCC